MPRWYNSIPVVVFFFLITFMTVLLSIKCYPLNIRLESQTDVSLIVQGLCDMADWRLRQLSPAKLDHTFCGF